MRQDLETNGLIGKGEDATFHILENLTGLHYQSLKFFKKNYNGIYRQVPIEFIISKLDYKLLSEPHQKGTIDIFIILNQKRIAVRVQGNGHGQFLKGLGKARHDDVQEKLLKDYCEVVNIEKRECPEIFKERVTNMAQQEITSSFKTANVLIPVV
jgi:hypothetical protein